MARNGFVQLAILIHAITASVTSTIEPDTGGEHHVFVFVDENEMMSSLLDRHKEIQEQDHQSLPVGVPTVALYY